MGKSVTMKSLVAALVICALALKASAFPFGNPDLDLEWEDFKQRYNKNYELDGEEQGRRMTWEANLNFIEEHNTAAANGEHSHTVGMNQFGDLTTDEINQFFNGYKPSEQLKGEIVNFENAKDDELPATVDWVNEGYVTGVKNQAQCGSCWAFSATGSLEGQMMLKKNKKVSLSEQQLVDCSGDFGNYGCSGGLMGSAFDYIKSVGGIESETDYPYRARDMSCKADKSKFVASVTGFKRIESGSEEALMKAVADVGPISVAIQATYDFQLYSGGVLIDDTCSPRRLNHGVLAVGYGTTTGSKKLDYWIVKN